MPSTAVEFYHQVARSTTSASSQSRPTAGNRNERSAHRVYVVDDDEGIREWLAAVIESVGLASEAYATGKDFLSAVDPDQPGCAVIDLRLPLLSGVDVASELRARGLALPVIMMSAYGEVRSAVEAIKVGAVEFLEKPFTGQVLLDQIHRALEVDATRRARSAEVALTLERLKLLTAKEREVLDAVLDGKPNKVTAIDLGVSEKAVEDRRARMMTKMGAGSLAELIRLVLTSGGA